MQGTSVALGPSKRGWWPVAGGGAVAVAVPGDWSPSPLLVAFVGGERKHWGYPGFWPGRVELLS